MKYLLAAEVEAVHFDGWQRGEPVPEGFVKRDVKDALGYVRTEVTVDVPGGFLVVRAADVVVTFPTGDKMVLPEGNFALIAKEMEEPSVAAPEPDGEDANAAPAHGVINVSW